eukprot:m.437751 g.437751  ORF g.437751 m.437751 type:complete len:67 (+) comp20273_c1_seq35:269-469(+)
MVSQQLLGLFCSRGQVVVLLFKSFALSYVMVVSSSSSHVPSMWLDPQLCTVREAAISVHAAGVVAA